MRLGERMLQHDHREDARAGADVAGARRDRAGGYHARSGISLGRAHRDAGGDGTIEVEERCAFGGEPARVGAGGEGLGQQGEQIHLGRELFVPRDEIGVVGDTASADREHARGVADAQHVPSREPAVHVSGEGRDGGDVRNVRLPIAQSLVEVGDRPAQRDVHPERLGELGRRRSRVRVAPRAERSEQPVAGVEREVSVHHRRDPEPDDLGGLSVARARFPEQLCDCRTHPVPHIVEVVGPQVVLEAVLPREGSGRDHRGRIRRLDETRLDARRAEFDAQYTLHRASSPRSCASAESRRSSEVCPYTFW